MRRGSAAFLLLAATSASPALADGFGTSRVWSSAFSPGAEKPLIGDFNGDGKKDAVSFVGDTLWDWRRGDVMVALSNGGALAAAAKWHDFFAIGAEVPVVGDWNGDGKDDIGLFKRSAAGDQAGDVIVALSNGASFGSPMLWHPYFGVGDELPAVGDWNGDGKDDVAVFKRSTTTDTGARDVLVARSNGTWFGTSEVWHDSFGAGVDLPATGDLDGDGRDDVLLFARTSAPGQVLAALDAAPSVLEPDSRAAAFGYDILRSWDGSRARGTRPLLALVVDFADQPIAPEHTAAFYRDLLFTGSDEFHSVAGFFRENSFGQFTWSEAAIVAPFRAPDDAATPNVNESLKICAKGDTQNCPGTTSNEGLLFTRAIRNAAASGVDFARYDTNHDFEVTDGELGIVVFSGSPNWDTNGVTGSFGVSGVVVNGPSGPVRVKPHFASLAEFTNFPTLVHELAHTLGTVDLYNSTNVMAMNASIMNNQVSSSATRASVELDAWHKMALGWIMPRIYDLTQPGACDYLNVSLADEFFEAASWYERPILLYDPRLGGREFFLIESRLKDSWFNRYDADVQENGVAVWYVQQDGNHRPVMIPGLKIEGYQNGLQTSPAPGSDDFLLNGEIWSGPDETWQTTLAGDDNYYWDRAVLQMKTGGRRGDTDLYTPADGRFRVRYLAPWADAELALQVASVGDVRWTAVRWGHHSLDVLPRNGNYCHSYFPQ